MRKFFIYIFVYYVDIFFVINVFLCGEIGFVYYVEEILYYINLLNLYFLMKMVWFKLLFRFENFIYLYIFWNYIFFIFCVCCKVDFF